MLPLSFFEAKLASALMVLGKNMAEIAAIAVAERATMTLADKVAKGNER